MRRFVIVGQTATASDAFLLDDLAGTSGRLDVLVRCVRAALLYSHGVRRDVIVYLVLLGGPRAPRALRFDGRAAKFLRPDERSLATLVKKTLAREDLGSGFVEGRHGVAIASGGVDVLLADCEGATVYAMEEGAPDIRDAELDADAVYFIGDHIGLAPVPGAQSLSVGPVSLHSEDVVAIVSNEIDRRLPASK
jgi:tRNA (pseudouridine54-N1)-methyltransferase